MRTVMRFGWRVAAVLAAAVAAAQEVTFSGKTADGVTAEGPLEWVGLSRQLYPDVTAPYPESPFMTSGVTAEGTWLTPHVNVQNQGRWYATFSLRERMTFDTVTLDLPIFNSQGAMQDPSAVRSVRVGIFSGTEPALNEMRTVSLKGGGTPAANGAQNRVTLTLGGGPLTLEAGARLTVTCLRDGAEALGCYVGLSKMTFGQRASVPEFPFEAEGGEASVSVPSDAVRGGDGSVTLTDSPLEVSVPAGVTAVTVTFEAEVPAGTKERTLAGVKVRKTDGKTPSARAFVNEKGLFDVGYYDGGCKVTGSQGSTGEAVAPERAVYTVIYERGGKGLELYRGAERVAWDTKVTWSDSTVTGLSLGGLQEAGEPVLAGMRIHRMKAVFGAAEEPGADWPEALAAAGAAVREYVTGLCGTVWPGESLVLPEVSLNGAVLAPLDAARALWFYGMPAGGGAVSRGVGAFEADGLGGIALTVTGDTQRNGAVSVLGCAALGGPWVRLASRPAPLAGGDTVSVDGETAGAYRFFRLRAEEAVGTLGPAAEARPAGGTVTLPTMPAVTDPAGGGAAVTVASFVFEGEPADLGAAAAEALEIVISGPGVVPGGTYTLTATAADGSAVTAEAVAGTEPMRSAGAEPVRWRLVFEGVFPASGVSYVLTGPSSVPGAVSVVSCSWGDAVAGSTARVAVRLADNPRADGLADASLTRANYRIPALVTDGAGEVIAVYDIRYRGYDLGQGAYSGLDLGESHSADRGASWSVPRVAVDVPNTCDRDGTWGALSAQTDIGDACTLYDPATETYWLMAMTGGGLFKAGAGSADNDCVLYRRTKGPDGRWTEWESPTGSGRSVKAILLEGIGRSSDPGLGILDGPGHGMVTRFARNGMPAGTLVFPMQAFVNGSTGNAQCFAAYSADHGRTWQTTALTPYGVNTQENCIVELDDGSWLMMAKGDSSRLFYRTTDFRTWSRLASVTPAARVQGSCLRIGTGADGRSRYVLCHQSASDRRNLSLFFGCDITADEGHDAAGSEGVEWALGEPYVIHADSTGGMGYNSLCMLDGQTLGVLYESNGHIYFERIDITPWLR